MTLIFTGRFRPNIYMRYVRVSRIWMLAVYLMTLSSYLRSPKIDNKRLR